MSFSLEDLSSELKRFVIDMANRHGPAVVSLPPINITRSSKTDYAAMDLHYWDAQSLRTGQPKRTTFTFSLDLKRCPTATAKLLSLPSQFRQFVSRAPPKAAVTATKEETAAGCQLLTWIGAHAENGVFSHSSFQAYLHMLVDILGIEKTQRGAGKEGKAPQCKL